MARELRPLWSGSVLLLSLQKLPAGSGHVGPAAVPAPGRPGSAQQSRNGKEAPALVSLESSQADGITGWALLRAQTRKWAALRPATGLASLGWVADHTFRDRCLT